MRRKTHMTANTLSKLFSAVLILHVSLIIPNTHYECRCGELYPHTSRCTCKCPKCVDVPMDTHACCTQMEPVRHDDESRHDHLKPAADSNSESLMNFCDCGSHQTNLASPDEAPFLPHVSAGAPSLYALPDKVFYVLFDYSEYSNSILPLPG